VPFVWGNILVSILCLKHIFLGTTQLCGEEKLLGVIVREFTPWLRACEWHEAGKHWKSTSIAFTV